ncbi:speckle-type POZ protein B-like [Copidosoma floridanum]|uniref:speckle-type POZ protein B-like n=1 Tax=Copidosoma floridanum TaxID=29053 RepID=UPI0006C9AA42|nr:speckle-type POZ protein B-like [Copidosoma floridanum]
METGSGIQIQIPEAIVSWTTFSIPGRDDCKLRFQLFPYGSTHSQNNRVSIFLRHVSKVDNMPLLSKFSFHSNNGRCISDGCKLPCSMSFSKNGHGHENFCKRTHILRLLEGDTLVIRCWMKWKKNENVSGTLIALGTDDTLIQLSNDYKFLINEGSFSDFTLEANDGTQFLAHKCVLSSRCPVLAAMFKHDMKEKQESKIQIKDLNGKTLKAILHFIYSGIVNEDECQITELLAAADKYGLEALEKCCEINLDENLKLDNCANYLILADLHDLTLLKDTSVKFITKNLKEVIKTDGYRSLLMTKPYLLDKILTAIADVQYNVQLL